MKKYFGFILFSICIPAYASALVTDSYNIEVVHMCDEGHVTCGNVHFFVKKLDSRAVQEYVGETMHSTCKDGSPCTFQGYRFLANNQYFLLLQDGTLHISDMLENLILEEPGKWAY